jgi:hypothetical protein
LLRSKEERCRLCPTIDRDPLAEQLAAEMHESRHGHEIDPPLDDAGAYGRQAMRQFAEATLSMLK